MSRWVAGATDANRPTLAGDNIFTASNDFALPPTVSDVPVATTGANIFTAGQRINGGFGLNVAPSVRQPVASIQVIDGQGGALAGTTDVVAHGVNTVFTGNFTGITGSNPGYAWGFNVFTATGSAAGDGAGLTNLWGGLVEAVVRTPAGTTIPQVIGLFAEAAFFGASAGASVGTMTSMRVGSPKRKDGATAGTVTGTAYGLFVEGVSASAVGAAAAQSLCVSSGLSWFGGPVTLDNQNLGIGSGQFTGRTGLFGRTDLPVGGRLTVYGDTTGNEVFAARGITGQTTDLIRAQRTTDDTNWTTVFGVTPNGVLRMLNANTAPSSNQAGGGYLYAEGGALKWRGSSGTITTIANA